MNALTRWIRLAVLVLGACAAALDAWAQPPQAQALADSLLRVISQSKSPETEFRARASLTSIMLRAGDWDRAGLETRILTRQARRLNQKAAAELARFYTLLLACLQADSTACAALDSMNQNPALQNNKLLEPAFDLHPLSELFHDQRGDHASALRWGQYTLRAFEQKPPAARPELPGDQLIVMASAAQALGLTDRALGYLQRALRVYQRVNSSFGVASAYFELGNLLSETPDSPPATMENAANYFMRAADLVSDMGRNDLLASALLGAADVHSKLGNWNEVKSLIDRVGEARNKEGRFSDLNVEFNWLQVHTAWGRHNGQAAVSVIDMGRRMVEIAESSANPEFVKVARFNLAEILNYYGQHAEARSLLEQVIAPEALAKRHDLQFDAMKLLANVCMKTGDWQQAARLYERISRETDSLAAADSRRQSRQLAEQFGSELKDLQIQQQQSQIERGNWQIAAVGSGMALLLALALLLVAGRTRLRRYNRHLTTKNQQIGQQHRQLAEQHLKIEDSIRYASRIQHAILPETDFLSRCLPPHFIFYRPKDIVSGDFYWAAQVGGLTLIAVVDCTGHGVPGAFMSVVGYNLLNQIVLHDGVTEPGAVLAELDRRIAQNLRQSYRGENQDGMDVALLAMEIKGDGKPKRVLFAGAKRPLMLLERGTARAIDGSRFSCGGAQHLKKQFETVEIDLNAVSSLWLYSDGLTDQFGEWDEKRKRHVKLGQARLNQWMNETAALKANALEAEVERRFTEWTQDSPQLDDVLCVGLKWA